MRQISDMISMKGRAAAVTGGCGHIGVAMAHALAEQGCALLLIDRNEVQLEETAAQLRARWPVEVAVAAIDLESEQQRSTVAGLVEQRFGRLDVLINNAGFVGDSKLQGWVAPFEEQSIETWRRAMEVNVTAAFHLSQQLAPLLRASGHGSILNVGSIYGVVGPDMSRYEGTPMGNPAAYAASKGGLVQLTRWLSTVMAPQVRVNCISPGGVARNQPESFASKYVARTPLKRMGREEDFMGAVVYFCSDLSAWVTGENLQVDGGWTVW
jgi:NAD(P)-dependent dehydrogenase (short-subunit alcohol dehydrogenase family)